MQGIFALTFYRKIVLTNVSLLAQFLQPPKGHWYLYQYDETSWILSHEFNMNPTSVEIDYSGNVILFKFSSTVEVYKKYGSDWHKTDQNFTSITRSALSQDGTSLVITDGNDDTAVLVCFT